MDTPLIIDDTCRLIAAHLPLVEVLVLIRNRIFPKLKNTIALEIKRRLRELDFNVGDPELFLTHLRTSGAHLSGSFLLAVLVTPIRKPLDWKVGDLDVYNHSGIVECSLCGAKVEFGSSFSEFMCDSRLRCYELVPYP